MQYGNSSSFQLLHSSWDKIFFLPLPSQTPIILDIKFNTHKKQQLKLTCLPFLDIRRKDITVWTEYCSRDFPYLIRIWFLYLCDCHIFTIFAESSHVSIFRRVYLVPQYLDHIFHSGGETWNYTLHCERWSVLSVTTWIRWSEMSRRAVG